MEYGDAKAETKRLSRPRFNSRGRCWVLVDSVALRRASRKDANQSRIVKALRDLGVSVYILNEPVDLVTGFRGTLRMLEVKDGDRVPSQRKLKPSQVKFMTEFAGCPVFKVENIYEALRIHGFDVAELE